MNKIINFLENILFGKQLTKKHSFIEPNFNVFNFVSFAISSLLSLYELLKTLSRVDESCITV